MSKKLDMFGMSINIGDTILVFADVDVYLIEVSGFTDANNIKYEKYMNPHHFKTGDWQKAGYNNYQYRSGTCLATQLIKYKM